MPRLNKGARDTAMLDLEIALSATHAREVRLADWAKKYGRDLLLDCGELEEQVSLALISDDTDAAISDKAEEHAEANEERAKNIRALLKEIGRITDEINNGIDQIEHDAVELKNMIGT